MPLLLALLLLSLLIPRTGKAQEGEPVNAAALQSGSFLRSTPSSYGPTNLMSGSVGEYTPEALFDLSPKYWCSEEGASFPHIFQLELTEPFMIRELRFNTICEEVEGIAARDVRVEFATDLEDPVYRSVGEFRLPEGKESSFPIPPTECRLIRLTILSNNGNDSYTELAEFAALGQPVVGQIRPVNVQGEWETNWGPVRFLQQGTSLEGDYDYHDGVILYGGIDRNRITYKWIEADYGLEGWTLLFMNHEGTRLTGVWCHGDDWSEYGFWIMERTTGHPFVPLTGQDEPGAGIASGSHTISSAVVEQMGATLQREERLILYGINFAVNSAEIGAESYNLLDHLAEVLKENGSLKIRIEGHTDNVGSDQENLILSLARATAVRDYLVNGHGITPDRLRVEGKGESQPMAANDTEAGKGANRRVEIHREK